MPQNKKTDPMAAIDAADLPDLTPKQMAFVHGLLAGKSASDAYRAAYDCQNMLDTTIWANASRLRSDANVAAWLAAARKNGLGSAVVTRESHLQELERLKALAIEAGNLATAMQGEIKRGEASGLYVNKFEDVTASDPVQTLKQIAESNPELAASLARQHDIPWSVDEGATKH